MECEEQISCSGARAVYRCDDCDSVQCAECFDNLHDLGSIYKGHNKRRIDVPLCRGPCSPKQQAVIMCTDCRTKLCQACNKKVHSGRRSGHKRSPLEGCVSTTASAESASQGADRRALEVDAQTNVMEMPLRQIEGATYQTQEGNETKQQVGVIRPGEADRDSPGQTVVTDLLISFDSISPLTTTLATDPQFSTNLDTLGWDSNAVDHLTGAPAAEAVVQSNGLADRRLSRDCQSLLLVNTEEKLMIDSVEELVHRLGIDPNDCVKVVSIFGNTGDGKSYTLNHAFFNGRDVFCTSPHQATCTIGVWCAYNSTNRVLFLDTEGMLGSTSRQKERIRLLLKILAISDVVIYRTRAERLHNDMYQFLSEASQAYKKYFASELSAVSEKLKFDKQHCGPTVIVFHETLHTELLGEGETPKGKSQPPSGKSQASKLLRRRFDELKLPVDAFSALHYIGTQTQQQPTEFRMLVKAVKKLVADISVRSPRRIEVVYQSLLVLNSKFSNDLPDESPVSFADEYFTCQMRCLVCKERCMISMNHEKDDIPHKPKSAECHYKEVYGNVNYICETCYNRSGKKNTVYPKVAGSKDSNWVGLMKYAWSGYVLECADCGIIYRSRQNWFGTTQSPTTAGAVRKEFPHVWDKDTHCNQATHNAARRLIEGVTTAATSVGRLTAPAASAMSDWVQDKVAPSYWVPNSQLKGCYKCNVQFNSDASKHHCRACGKGFCDDCSSKRCPVPSRGWGDTPVRVCDACFEEKQQRGSPIDTTEGGEGSLESIDHESADSGDIMARKVTEAVRSAVGVVASAVGYSKEFITDSARPDYWVPDAQIINCIVCNIEFGDKVTKHHCRSCGNGVCGKCSNNRLPVPSRGWDEEVRVCDTCAKKNHGNENNSKRTD